jgi:hypothetical protein
MAITEISWDGSEGRFSDEEWAHSCILDMGDCSAASKQATAKQRYKLPIREPNGDLNVNALGSAAGALGGARTPLQACPAAKKAAARRLVTAYGEAKLDVPEHVTSLAG